MLASWLNVVLHVSADVVGSFLGYTGVPTFDIHAFYWPIMLFPNSPVLPLLCFQPVLVMLKLCPIMLIMTVKVTKFCSKITISGCTV